VILTTPSFPEIHAKVFLQLHSRKSSSLSNYVVLTVLLSYSMTFYSSFLTGNSKAQMHNSTHLSQPTQKWHAENWREDSAEMYFLLPTQKDLPYLDSGSERGLQNQFAMYSNSSQSSTLIQ
jgi:hypothetical protein